MENDPIIPSDITALDIEMFLEQFLHETPDWYGRRRQVMLQFKAWVRGKRKMKGRTIPHLRKKKKRVFHTKID